MAVPPARVPPPDDPDPDYCAFVTGLSPADGSGGPGQAPAELPARLAHARGVLLALRDAGRLAPAPAAPPAGAPALRPGGRVGRFELLRQVGRGGAGVVFEARDPALSRSVAVKVLHPARAAHPSWGERFRAEGPALAKLRHPHVVRVFEAGEADGLTYLAMELVAGPDLHTRLAAGPLPAAEAAGVVAALADAVAHAHAQGVLHRDLKPHNVLLDPAGGPKVADFGLSAPLAGGGTGLTAAGEVVGTPEYLAPEALAGVGGPATDVYGLGAVLYECLTGHPPFAGGTHALALIQVRVAEPLAPRAVNPAVPRDLETVCLKCLEKQPGRRYAAAADVAADLRRFLAGRPVRARRPGPGERVAKWARRRPAAAALPAVGFAAAAAGLAGWGHHTRRLSAALEEVKKEQAATAAALALADKRADQLDRTNQALLGVFRDVNVDRVRDKKVTVERTLADRLVALAGRLDEDALGGSRAAAHIRYDLGRAVHSLGFPDQALPLHTAAHRAFLTADGPDHHSTLAAANELATTLGALRRYDEALVLREEVFRRREAIHGSDAPETLWSLGNLITTRAAAGKEANALPLREDLLARQTRAAGPDDPAVLSTTYNLAAGYLKHKQPERAVALLEPAVGRFRAVRGEDASLTLSAVAVLGQAYMMAGQRDKAVAFMADARERMLPALGPGHTRVLVFTQNLARAYEASGRPDAARRVLAETADAVAERHARDAVALAAEAHDRAGDPARAERWRAELVEFAKAADGADSKGHAAAALDLGLNLLAQKKWAEAEPMLVRAHELAVRLPDEAARKEAAAALVRLYEGWGRPTEAAKWGTPTDGRPRHQE